MNASDVQNAIDTEVANRNSKRGVKEEKYQHERTGGGGFLAAEGEIILGRERLQYGITTTGELQTKRYFAGGSGLMDNPAPSDIRSGPSYKLDAKTDVDSIAQALIATL